MRRRLVAVTVGLLLDNWRRLGLLVAERALLAPSATTFGMEFAGIRLLRFGRLVPASGLLSFATAASLIPAPAARRGSIAFAATLGPVMGIWA